MESWWQENSIFVLFPPHAYPRRYLDLIYGRYVIKIYWLIFAHEFSILVDGDFTVHIRRSGQTRDYLLHSKDSSIESWNGLGWN